MANELVISMRLPDRSDVEACSRLAIERAAIHAVSIIQRRTAKGQGSRGPFAPYTRNYAARKQASGRNVSPPDLTLTGTLLRGLRMLRVEPGGRRAWIGWEGQHTTRNVLGALPFATHRVAKLLGESFPLRPIADKIVRDVNRMKKSELRKAGKDIISVPYAVLVQSLEKKRPFFGLTPKEMAECRDVYRKTMIDGLSRRISKRLPTKR